MTDGSGDNHMEYDYSNADRLGDDAWIGCGFFYGKFSVKKRTVPCIRCGTAEYRQSREEIFRMFKTDLQIAQECNMEHILKVAEKAGIPEE